MTDKTQTDRAFPWCGDLNETPTINLGMTLRDYFAAKAMSIAYKHMIDQSIEWGVEFEMLSDDISFDVQCAAYASYEIADAMLKARE